MTSLFFPSFPEDWAPGFPETVSVPMIVGDLDYPILANCSQNKYYAACSQNKYHAEVDQ
jgi:hypothetical protein